ncbi:immunodominant staphylococcal antigen IsaB family protein, partial [Staphylococcus haemolyticus]|uniref:immunodominant staphylococcal antigen IsaB family protein n=1 Tax=Staphylococcus haemolyticus TaxID=1283 RepID=UPI003B7FBEBC
LSFVLDKNFKNEVKAENVKFNFIKLKATTSSKNVKKYDQYFRNVSKDCKTASLLDLNVTGKMTLYHLNKTYGKDLQKV